MVDLNSVKEFVRVDEGYDDNLLEGHIIASEEYLKNAGVKEEKKKTKIYDLAVKIMVKALYDGEDFTKNAGLKAIIIQLVYSS